MNEFFTAPPEGAEIPTQSEKMLFLNVDWKSQKVAQSWVSALNETIFNEWSANGKIGFTYYDSEEKKSVTIPRFSFVVIDLVAACDGTEWGPDKKPVARYRSNRVFDTRTQRIAVWLQGSQNRTPVVSGLYKDIKTQLPEGVGYKKYIVAYCIELDALVEIDASKIFETALKRCLAALDNEKGKKTKWEQISIYNLAQNDHLWGFSFAGYDRQDANQNPYAGVGELYFAPKIRGGIVDPSNPNAKELHEKVADLQTRFRAIMAEKLNRANQHNAASANTEDRPATNERTSVMPGGAEWSFPVVEPPAGDYENDPLPF
jgi:hypothetical protein